MRVKLTHSVRSTPLTKEVFLLTSCNEVNMKTELYGLKGCVSMGINTVSAWYMMRFKVFI